MTQYIIAAQDTPADEASVADVRCDYASDMKTLAGIITRQDADVQLLRGNFNLNGGRSSDPKGGGYLRPGRGTTVRGDPLNTFLRAKDSMVRITVDQPDIFLEGFTLVGYAHIQLFGTAHSIALDDITIQQSNDGKTYLDMKPKGGCTAAFLFYAAPGQILQDVKVRGCRALMAYHHGFSMHVYGAQEGAEFKDFLVEDCLAEACGAGYLTPRDWACGFLFADTGHVTNLLVRRCWGVNNLQSGFHCDGNWTGHAQRITNVRYIDCHAQRNGVRCSPTMVEKFRSGFYQQSGEFTGCTAKDNAGPGFGFKNEVAGSLIVDDCWDDGSLYGMILEYAGRKAWVKFTSANAKRRAFQGQVRDGVLDLTVKNPPEQAITFGRTQRIDYLDCPNHAAEVTSKYNVSGPWPCTGSDITIRTADGKALAIEWWRIPQVPITWAGLAPAPVEDETVPPEPLPPKNRMGSFKVVDFCVWYQAGNGQWVQLPTPFLPDEARDYFMNTHEYVPKE